jgi:hypothetical protein
MGEALYAIYDDLAAALSDGRAPVSPLDSALATAAVVDRLMAAAPQDRTA